MVDVKKRKNKNKKMRNQVTNFWKQNELWTPFLTLLKTVYRNGITTTLGVRFIHDFP